jgi:putative oxidoreductase
MLQFLFGKFKPAEDRAFVQYFAFSAVMLVLRLLLAQPFWRSGQTRWVPFPSGFLTNLASSTRIIFANEFSLHFFWGEMAIPFPEVVAYLTATFEILLPIVIVAGLLTRLGALGLLGMTCVIQLVFPDGLVNVYDPMNSHLLWMVYAIVILACGPGMFSTDWLVRRFGFGRRLAHA